MSSPFVRGLTCLLACAVPALHLELGAAPPRPEVWASLTTTIARADQIDLVVQSLLRQSHPPRAVTVRVTTEETLAVVRERCGVQEASLSQCTLEQIFLLMASKQALRQGEPTS